jgi:hypothetical protein
VTLVNLGARRLGLTGEAESRDLAQARLAIEGARALMPLVPQEGIEPVRDALSQLQMAFVRETGPGGVPGAEPSDGAPDGAPTAPAEPAEDASAAAEEAERAKARAKIWTPPGT